MFDIGGIVSIMIARRPADIHIDQSSTPGTGTAAEPNAAPSLAVPTNKHELEPRHLLPKDLAGALTRLSDSDIDNSAVTKELRAAVASRRGPPQRSQPRCQTKP